MKKIFMIMAFAAISMLATAQEKTVMVAEPKTHGEVPESYKAMLKSELRRTGAGTQGYLVLASPSLEQLMSGSANVVSTDFTVVSEIITDGQFVLINAQLLQNETANIVKNTTEMGETDMASFQKMCGKVAATLFGKEERNE